MNYKQVYFEEIFESMLNDSLEKGLISHAEDFPSYIANQEDISNYYVMDKSVIALIVAKVYEAMTDVYNRMNIQLAEGVDLDNIGDWLGIVRPSATYAMAELTFSISNVSDEDIQVDDGLIVSTSNNIQYRTLDPVYIPVDETECNVQAVAVVPGVGSKVSENTLNTIVSDLPTGVSLNVTNNSGSSGGREEYSDDEYRELLLSWPLIYLKGSLEAYENYFANFDGLDGFNIVPNWSGSGTVKIVLDPGTDYQLNQAYEGIRESVCQIDSDITLFAPTTKYIDIYVVCNTDIDRINPYSLAEKDTIQSRIKTAIKVFIDGGYRENGEYYPGLLLGEDFIPHKLGVFLDDEIKELKDINFNYPTEYIPILDEEIGVSNNITIEMI